MKKLWGIVWLCLLLAGCGGEETFETVADPVVVPAAAPASQILIRLPEEAAALVLAAGERQIYECGDYEILLETRPSGDFPETVRYLTGFDADALTVVQTRQGDYDRYEFVWSCAGEQGQRMGRGAVLDDGNRHYCLSVLWDTAMEAEAWGSWQQVFASFTLDQS